MTDPIGDMLTRIRNAQQAGRESAEVPFSRLKYALAKILEQQGFVRAVEFKGRGHRKSIIVRLRYKNGIPALAGAKRISKPGQRMYAASQDIGTTKGGHGLAILSTSQGLMTEREARKQNVGGEIVCRVW